MISNNLAFLSNCIIYKLNVRGGIFNELKTLLRRDGGLYYNLALKRPLKPVKRAAQSNTSHISPAVLYFVYQKI